MRGIERRLEGSISFFANQSQSAGKIGCGCLLALLSVTNNVRKLFSNSDELTFQSGRLLSAKRQRFNFVCRRASSSFNCDSWLVAPAAASVDIDRCSTITEFNSTFSARSREASL